MANFATLKAAINAVIKTNGNKEITGEVLNQVLNAMVTSLGANYQFAGVATPSTNPGTPDQNVFYMATEAGTYTNFNATVLPAGISILLWNGSWSHETFFEIDSVPTSGSDNLISSGAVFEKMKLDGGAYDVSAHNEGATFASLSALLNSDNLNTLIPVNVRHGGMSIKFVQSSDNNYIQVRCMANSFTTDVNQWQGVDNEPIVGSKNLVKSEGVAKMVAVSNNETINKYILNVIFDFGTSGKSLSDISKVRLQHVDDNGFGLTLFTSGWVAIAAFEYKRNLTDYYESTVNGITIKAIVDLTQPHIDTDTTFQGVVFYDRALDITKNPYLYKYIPIKTEVNGVKTEVNGVKEITDEAFTVSTNSDVNAYIKDIYFDFGTSGHTLSEVTRIKMWYNDANAFQIVLYNDSYQLIANFGYNRNLVNGEYEGSNNGITCKAIIDLSQPRIPSSTWYNNTSFYAKATDLSQHVRWYAVSNEKAESISKQLIGKSASKHIVYVKSDGSGDYVTVQSALNNIKDASINNQYEIRLCNDEIYTDMSDLWLVSDPYSHSAVNPTAASAAIVTKNWVTIVGYNQKRNIIVNAPDTMAVTSQQYVQCMYLRGCSVVDNINFIIKNGRYAIHQESGGDISSLDYNARTIMRNCNVVHLGNVHGTGYWNSCYAQANGACAGLQVEYHNVVWSPAFYMHQNANFDCKNTYLFENCRILYPKNGKFDNVDLGVYIGMNGSGQNSHIEFKGCDMHSIEFRPGMMGGNLITDAAKDIRTMIPEWVGYGNRKMVIPTYDFGASGIALKTTNNNVNVKVVGGTAKADIYGEDMLYYDGTTDDKGYCCGSEFYGYRDGDYSYTLAHRLGNCANSPKTLIVEIGGVEQTVTFDANFVTADGSAYTYQTQPAYSDSQILTYISNQLSGAATIQFYLPYRKGYPMNDTSEYGINYSNNTIVFGAGVKRDTSNPFGWVNCAAGEVPEGIACERINPNGGGLIALIDKNYFKILYGISITTTKPTGTMLKIYGGGEWTETSNASEAILIAVAPNVFSKK